ncbi:MAG: biopolymer transporter ExbD [Verrucomicrobia bacterium]|nr:MAG: biopolymer transporter ExbD [Verrucomicrobiota bacterium]
MSLLLPKARQKPFINIVPLIDVLIVLIFFILMTMQFRNVNLLNITPPKMDEAPAGSSRESISIAIDSEGAFYFEGNPITQNGMENLFLDKAKENKEQPVILLADQESAIKHMTSVMDAARKAGLAIRLQVR